MMQQPFLTVFTPTFNRAYCLGKLYDSLVAQTNQHFIWLVVDDGSTDDTEALVSRWKSENKINIDYCYKPNGGMHSAHNTAYRNLKTPFNTCIDSDDFMPADAVQIIWDEIQDLPDGFAGIIGLDATEDGSIIGTKIPENLTSCTLTGLYQQHGVHGDKKLVYSTEVITKYAEYPEYEGEKFVPLGFKYALVDQDYVLKPVNKVLCIVEYLPDGSSRNILTQYRCNPRGFAFSRISRIGLAKTHKEKFKNSIHLVSSSLFLNNFGLLLRPKNKLVTLAALPFGALLNVYIRFKTRKAK